MRLHQLQKTQIRSKKRLGRGLGSGKGKTAGRGSKGQKARGTVPVTFIGGLPLYKKLPLKRGKGNRQVSVKQKIISLSQLNVFKAKEVIDVTKLLEAKIISEKDIKRGIKILGNGEISQILTIKLPVSSSARNKIEKLGGKVDNV
ncbi:MAG: 50S ribosomal protein L15 [Candidatus Daviesbacteria bacterium]|nr:50S ribosomal protein L15 [Candidatus Daviesbacteria bacterium]